MAIMFKKIPCLGSLYLEKTLYGRSEPEVFVCTDGMGKRYLCVARLGVSQWLMARINTRHLIAVLKDHLSIQDAMRLCTLKGVVTGRTGKYTFSLGLSEDDYPDGNRYLELWDFDEGVHEYCEELKTGRKEET